MILSDYRLTISLATRGNDIYYGTMLFMLEAMMSHPVVKIVVASGFSAIKGQEMCFGVAVQDNSDWFYLIDADVMPVANTIEKLMARNLPIVVSPVPMYLPEETDIHWNACDDPMLQDRKVLLGTGLQEIVASSFASILIRCDVLQEFKRRGEGFTHWSAMLPEWCRGLHSDSIFFLKARRMGFNAYIDWDIKPAVHHRYVALSSELIEKTVERADRERSKSS